jgi:hypothetical protein
MEYSQVPTPREEPRKGRGLKRDGIIKQKLLRHIILKIISSTVCYIFFLIWGNLGNQSHPIFLPYPLTGKTTKYTIIFCCPSGKTHGYQTHARQESRNLMGLKFG